MTKCYSLVVTQLATTVEAWWSVRTLDARTVWTRKVDVCNRRAVRAHA